MYKRLLVIDKKDNKSMFLFGPRGTGKTSWVKDHFQEALYIDLLKTRDYTELLADPSRLESKVLAYASPWVIIDEVQKIPALLDEVHRLIEHHNKCFILTGSSSRKLKRDGANLLAGRAIRYHMHPLTALELGDSFDLDKALLQGTLPAVFQDTNPKAFLETYAEMYLREEVIQEGLVRNVGAFSRFMEIASFSQGNQVNSSAIAREVGVSQKVISSYFEILEDLLIAIRIPIFSKHAKRKLMQHPVFYYFDVGVFQQLRPKGPLDAPAEIGGAAFETLFLQHLRAYVDYFRLDLKIFYWRTTTGVEVDFVLYGHEGLFAFELKSRTTIQRKDFSGLKKFKEDYPIAKTFLVYAGTQKEQYGDHLAVPINELLNNFLSMLSITN